MEKNIKDGFLCHKILIQNDLGLHARAAAKLVKLSSMFASDVYIEKDDCRVNGKSIIGILTLAAECGSEIEIAIKGDDADTALKEIILLIEDKFGE